MAAIFAEVLGLERVGVHDDFFALGGHSLLATQAVTRLRKAFAAQVPLRALFDGPTVEAMVNAIIEQLATEVGEQTLAAILREI